MITDAEFWMHVRRRSGGGEGIFQGMLALLHARQVALAAPTTTIVREEYMLRKEGERRTDIVTGIVLTAEERERREAFDRRLEANVILDNTLEPVEENKALPPPFAAAPRRVATVTMRVLQQVMLFAVPIYTLRYNIPAMSISWDTACCIDYATKQLVTFGAGGGVSVPPQLYGRGCVAGEGFFAILTDRDEVWASGKLEVPTPATAAANPNSEPAGLVETKVGSTVLGRDNRLTGIAGKTLMLVGHGERLASVTHSFTVRPLSVLSTAVRSIMPPRRVRFLDLGYGEDYYMVGVDSVLYKTTASKRAVGTPRRVMTLSHMAVSRVSSGSGFLLLIDQNGHLHTMGRNKSGQLGIGRRQEARRLPYFHEDLAHHFFVQVAAGDRHALALTSNGIVYGTGSNEVGQLGLGEANKIVTSFTPIPLPCKCIGIAAGPAGSMFACEDGSVLACGMNGSKQLGIESLRRSVYVPTAIPLLQEGVVSYTLDFGGYRRSPGGVGGNSNEVRHAAPSPSSKQEENGLVTHATNGATSGSNATSAQLNHPDGMEESGGGNTSGAKMNHMNNNVSGSSAPGAPFLSSLTAQGDETMAASLPMKEQATLPPITETPDKDTNNYPANHTNNIISSNNDMNAMMNSTEMTNRPTTRPPSRDATLFIEAQEPIALNTNTPHQHQPQLQMNNGSGLMMNGGQGRMYGEPAPNMAQGGKTSSKCGACCVIM